MFEFEKKLIRIIQNHSVLLFYIAATIIGILLHFSAPEFRSGDINVYLGAWWNKIADQGVEGLAVQVGNYNIPYQIIIFLMSRFDIDPVIAYKLLSSVFDFALAVSAALLVRQICGKENRLAPVITYTLVVCSFNTWLNSAFWAQCDSIYVTFIVLAILFTLKNRHIAAFVMLGVSFAFKLQVIFILPAFLFYYVTEKKISILHFLIIPAVNTVMCLPAVLFGRPFHEIFTVYFDQTQTYHQTYMNFPSIFVFMVKGNNSVMFEYFRIPAILITLLVLGMGLLYVMKKNIRMDDAESFLKIAVWTLFTCLIFMPGMHERYSYLLDILLIVYVIKVRKRYWTAVVSNLISLRGYCFYLFGEYQAFDINLAAMAFLGLYVYISVTFARELLEKAKARQERLTELTGSELQSKTV